jgi:hypothetical protein
MSSIEAFPKALLSIKEIRFTSANFEPRSNDSSLLEERSLRNEAGEGL